MYPAKRGNNFSFALAVPANASDPLYTRWTKSGRVGGRAFKSPVLTTNVYDVPSTAWRTAEGEWRMIGHFPCEVPNSTAYWSNGLYASDDFVSWRYLGCTQLPHGDCPTLFPLPRLTPGSSAPSGAPLPTHVHKAGDRGDAAQVGVWRDGRGTMGTWAPAPARRACCSTAASRRRRLLGPGEAAAAVAVGLSSPARSSLLASEVTYHATLQRLVYAPIEEL